MASTFVLLMTPLSEEDFEALTNISAAEQAAVTGFALVSIYSQAVAVLGGIMAIQRKNWKLAVVCGVFSLLTFGFFLLSSLLGLAGLLLVLGSRHEFTS